MTIATTDTRVSYTADGILTQFSFTFRTLDEAHIKVYKDGVIQPTGFTVTLNADQDASPGGDVDFTGAPADETVITIQRIVPNVQATEYTPYDPFPAESHETALDKLTMQVQQNVDELDRAIVAPVEDDGLTDFTMPLYEAGKVLAWHATLQKIVNAEPTTLIGLADNASSVKITINDAQVDFTTALNMVGINKIEFDDDASIFHNGGSAWAFSNVTGNIAIEENVNSGLITLLSKDSGGTNKDGIVIGGATPQVKLYYDGAKRFETTNGGMEVSSASGNNFISSAGEATYFDIQGLASYGKLAVNSSGANGGFIIEAKGSGQGYLRSQELFINDIKNADTIIEIGYTGGTANTSYVDFHTGATSTDYDSRIQATGGDGTAGNGTLEFIADTVKINSINLPNIPTSASGLSSGDVWSNGGILTIV